MYPAHEYAKVLYQDRLRDAEQARLVRSQKQQQEPVVQLRRRRGWVRALFGRKAVAR